MRASYRSTTAGLRPRRTLLGLCILASLASSTVWGQITASPAVVEVFPSQTSASVNLTLVFEPDRTGAAHTGTVVFSGIPSEVTTDPVPVTFPIAPGATRSSAAFRFVASPTAPPAAYSVSLSSRDILCGGILPCTGTIMLVIKQPSFAVSVIPNPVRLEGGAAPQTVTVTTQPEPGFTEPVTYTFSGFPAGIVWGSPGTVSPPYGPLSFQFSAAAGTPPGTYPGLLTATAAGVPVKTFPMTVVVARPGLLLSFSQPSVSVCDGGVPVNDAVVLQPRGGYVGTPVLSLGAVPAGVALDPPTLVAQPMPPGQTIPFTVKAAGASSGAHVISLNARDSAAGINVTAQLTVSVDLQDMTPSTVPSSISLQAGGGQAAVTVLLNQNPCFNKPTVTVSASSMPAGLTVTPPQATITGPPYAPAVFRFSAAASMPSGTYTVGFNVAAGAGFVRTTFLNLTVTEPPDFTLSVTPGQVTLVRGESTRLSVGVTPVRGFAGNVSVSVAPVQGLVIESPVFSVPAGGLHQLTLRTTPGAQPGPRTLQFEGVAQGIAGVHRTSAIVDLMLPAPTIDSLTPPSVATATEGFIVRISGANFRPGAIASSPSADLQISRTIVLSDSIAEMMVSVRPGAGPGPRRIDLTNIDGTTTPRGGQLLVYSANSIGAPLGVTTAAIVFPRPDTIITGYTPLYPRGLLATTGMGTIVGAWALDGVPFDYFTINTSGGIPVKVASSVPIPKDSVGGHRLELMVEQPRSLVSAPVDVVVAPDSKTALEIFSPEAGVILDGEPIEFRWSLVPGASGFELEIQDENGERELLRRLSEASWRPSDGEIATLGAGRHRFNIRPVYPGEVRGEGTAWRSFVILPEKVELRLSPAPDGQSSNNRTLRWEGGMTGLTYRVNLYRPGQNEAFSRALTRKEIYRLPENIADGLLLVRVEALDGKANLRGSSNLVVREFHARADDHTLAAVPASLSAKVSAVTPSDNAAISESRPTVGAAWNGALGPQDVRLVLDCTDLTGICKVAAESIVCDPQEDLENGRHTVTLTLAGAVTKWNFVIDLGEGAEAEEAPPPSPGHRNGEAALMGTLTGQEADGSSQESTARVQVTGRTDFARGEGSVKATADLAGRHDMDAPTKTVLESRNWDFLAGFGSPALRVEGRLGFSPPDFLDQSQLLMAGLARGGIEGKLVTSLGSVAYYRTENTIPSATVGMPLSGPQRVEAFGYEAPGDGNRWLFRAFYLSSETEASAWLPGGTARGAGFLGKLSFGPGLALVLEGAHGTLRRTGYDDETSGNAFRVAATGAAGRLNWSLGLRKTESTFINPLNPGLTVGGVPDRKGGDLSLATTLGKVSVSLQAHRMESGGNAGVGPRVVENGGGLNLNLPVGQKVALALAGTLTTNSGDSDENMGLPATDRSQKALSLNLTETLGRTNLVQTLSWQQMRDEVLPDSNQELTGLNLTANSIVSRVVSLMAMVSGTRTKAAPAMGTTDQVLVTLQPTVTLAPVNLSLTFRGTYDRVTNNVADSVTQSEQYQVIVQWSPGWLGSLLALQVSTGWSRMRSSYQPSAPFHQKVVLSLTLRRSHTYQQSAAPQTAAGLSPVLRPLRMARRL